MSIANDLFMLQFLDLVRFNSRYVFPLLWPWEG